MAEYINKQTLMNDLKKFAPECKAALLIAEKQPKADVVPVCHELRKAVELLEKNYQRGLNSDFVHNPVAWALYQTWKQMDGGADNGERKSDTQSQKEDV